jgi:broad specificity phosphatase PhoE
MTMTPDAERRFREAAQKQEDEAALHPLGTDDLHIQPVPLSNLSGGAQPNVDVQEPDVVPLPQSRFTSRMPTAEEAAREEATDPLLAPYRGAMALPTALKHLAPSPNDPGTYKQQAERGATETLRAAGDIASPVMLAGAIAQPEISVAAILGGVGGEYGAGKLADAVKTSPETKELLQQVGGLAGSIAGGGIYGGARAAVDPTDALADLLWKRGYIQDNQGRPIHIGSQSEAMAVAQEMIKQNPQGFVESIRNGYSWRKAAQNIPARQNMGVAEPAGMPLGLPGEVPPAAAAQPPQTPAPPPVEPMHSITAEEIAEVGDKIAKLPVEDRPQATLAAHTSLSAELLKQGKLITPDGKLQIISNQKQAESLAQKLINEEIGRQDAQAKQSAKEPVPAPPAGFVLEENQGESKPQAPAFQKGDRVTLPKGDTGTIAHMNSRLIRVSLDSGGKASVPAEQWGKVQKVQSENATPTNAAATPAKEAGASLPTQEATTTAGVGNGEPVSGGTGTSGGDSAPRANGGSERSIEQAAAGDVSKGQIIFARHGETKLDQAGANETVAGWTQEPLDDRGKAAAAKLADDIEAQKPTVIITSDLARAKQTAEIVGKQLGIPVQEDSRLRPQHVPETEGLKVGEATPIWENYESSPDKKPEGGESWNEARARQDAALKDVEAKVAAGERPVVLTHSRNLEMELGERPKPGGFITRNGRTEAGSNQPAKGVESGNGKTHLSANDRSDTGSAPAAIAPRSGDSAGSAGGPTDHLGQGTSPRDEGGTGGAVSGVQSGALESSDEGNKLPQRVEDNKPSGTGRAEGTQASNPTPGRNEPGEPVKYKFGSTQANIPADSEAAKALTTARSRISDADLAGKGKQIGDGGNHVTVRYGIKGEDTEKIKSFLSAQSPFEATLGKTEKFPVSEHSEGSSPIIAPIEAPELHRLNAELEKHGDFAEPSFKEYKPHATVAYVDPAKADRYVGMTVTEGKKFTVFEIAISKKDGSQEVVKLEGKKAVEQPRRESWRSKPAETKPSAELAPGKVGEMKVSDLKVAPAKFQYKLSTDAEGVGTLLKETKVFNPDLAGVISVWRDPADGKTYVVNGHHRYELAKRLGVKTVTVRHIVAPTANAARAIGALQNIAEGRGTAIDAAKFFHDSNTTPEELSEKGISLGEKTASDGFAMSRLDPNILAKVINGDLRQGLAVAIGEGTGDHAQQAAILKQVDRMERKGQKVSDSRVREFIRLANQTEKRTEETTSLFGTEQVERSLLWEKSAVSEYIQEQIKKDKKLFGFVSKGERATELERGGNKIDVEKSKEISTGAAQAEEVYNRLSSRGGPIASILDEAARKLADGDNAATVKSEAYQRVRADISQTLGGGERSGARRPEGTPETEPDSGAALFSPETELSPTEVSPPFYSKAARVAFEKLPASGTGSSFLATLKNAGVKEDEIKWLGLDDFLKDRFKVAKKDALSYIMKNMVQVREIAKTQPKYMTVDGHTVPDGAGGLVQNRAATKYDTYTLPGEKKNYTELLLTLPAKPGIAGPKGWGDTAGGTSDTANFQSGHFDEPNILAHVRFDERTDADGKPILFVEEVQSDWHQKGKKVGYKNADDDNALREKMRVATEASRLAYADLRPLLVKDDLGGWDTAHQAAIDAVHVANGEPGNEYSKDTLEAAKKWGAAKDQVDDINHRLGVSLRGVRNAPFKSDWHELAMKTMLRKAAEGGYDKIGWVTGQQTAERYDLSKSIQSIGYVPFTGDKSEFTLTAVTSDGRHIDLGTKKASELSEVVGKDIAEKITKGEGEGEGAHKVLSGLDLKTGGEWAKNLYDRAIPNFLSKYGKKWGAKVGDDKLALTDRSDKAGRAYTPPQQIHAMAVTPEMRASVLSEGQPLFSPASDPVPPSMAKGVKFEVKATKEGLPSYLRLNPNAIEAINQVLGVRINGVNIDSRMVPEIATKLKAEADRLGGSAQTKLRELANAMLDHADPEFGLSIIREGKDEAQELAALHEELLHAAGRKAGKGDLVAGTPWREAFEDEGIRKMAAERIIPGLVQNGLRPRAEVVASEAMVDLLRGDAVHDLTPEQIEKSSENYFAAMAAHSGIESVEAVQAVQDYIAARKAEKGISYGEEAERARDAGQRGLRRAIEGVRAGGNAPGRGKEITRGGGEVQEKPGGGPPEGSSTASLANDVGRPRESWRSPRPAETTSTSLHSTQPIGLTDEELEDWSKAKGFRVESAGEQLGMFGGNDQVMRVFRAGRGGKEQKALVYQSQLDQLNQPKPEPAEPFALTGGESREEQPGLFGAGDLGEIIGSGKGSGITLPSRERESKDTSLFSSERGEARPGELAKTVAEAAGAVGDYLRDIKRNTDLARDLERGFETLGTRKQSRRLAAVQTMRKLNIPRADDVAVDAHLDDPENEPLTPVQDKVLDDVVLPILEHNEEMFKELNQGGVAIENYSHRMVKGKRGLVDRMAQGVKSSGTGGVLSKSAPQLKHRVMMALESPSGERKVVSIKNGQVTAWKDGEPENLGGISHTEEGKVFEDKDGEIWTVKQATKKEIEADSNVSYYHSAIASALASSIQLGDALDNLHFLEAFKSSPEFKEIAWQGSGNPPEGWKPTTMPQFKDYYFEPRTAEVLNKYDARMQSKGPSVMDEVGKFLRISMLLNPIRHPLNVAASWAFEKGVTGFLPHNWGVLWRTSNKAVKAVLGQNQDLLDALDAGGALQSHRDAVKEIGDLFLHQVAEALEKKEPWPLKLAESLGIEHGNLLNLIHEPSSKIAWTSSDIMMLQSAYEYQAKHPGVELKDALKEVGRIIPEYRVPTRIFDSALIAKVMGEKWATIFGGYRYSLLKAFAETAKSALGAQEPAPGRTKAQEIGKGWDRIAMLGLGLLVMKYGLDELTKKLTKDEHATFWRVGPFGLMQAAIDVAEHKQSASQALTRVATPAPVLKSAAELATNREFFSGHQIYDPHADWWTEGRQLRKYLESQVGQIGQFEQAETSEQKRKFWWSQGGVTFAKTRAEKIAGDIAASKVGTEAELPEDHENRVQRREILDQLRKGNAKPLEEAERQHTISAKQAKSLKSRSQLQPLEDVVYNFTVEEMERVLKAARADKNEKEISLLENILHKKVNRANSAGAHYSWQKELATTAP